MSSQLQFSTTASQTSIHSFSLQYLSLYSDVALLYTSVINLSLSKILKSKIYRVYLLGTQHKDLWPCICFAARVRKQVCSFVFHCHRQPHRPENEARCVWKNAVKQLSMRSLPLKTKHSISAAKNNLCGSNRSCALALKGNTCKYLANTSVFSSISSFPKLDSVL